MNPLIQLSTASNPLLVRKTFLQTILAVAISILAPIVAHADSATWDLDPISGDWNTADNWTPNEVPNGPADTATFALSNTTDVSISANTEVNGIIFTAAATNPYNITVSSGLTLTISGTGIVNNSGTTQNSMTSEDEFGIGKIVFSNNATAGSNVSIVNIDGSTSFFNSSSAGSAEISNFLGGEGANDATHFFDNSNAGSSTIFNNFGNGTSFSDSSSAGNADIESSAANVSFADNPTAGSAFIGLSESVLDFFDHSTAGNATIVAGFTSLIFFFDSSRGGRAQIGLSDGALDISQHNAPGVTIGSIEGDGNVFLGANTLTVGSNNLSTTFSGVMQGPFGGTGGSLTKIGSGTLILSGANTYTGDTNVNGGVLQVDGSITSNTFVNHRGTLAGTGTINGNVMNTGTVRPGGALGTPGVLTVVGNYTQAQYATLMIQIAGTSPDQFSVLNVLGTANLNGYLDPVLLNGLFPRLVTPSPF